MKLIDAYPILTQLKKNWLLIIIWLFFVVLYSFFAYSSESFSQDTARDYILIKNYIANQDLIINYGPKTSVGNFALPPLYYQIHLILTLIFPTNYLIMTWFSIATNALAPVLLFILLKNVLRSNQALMISVCYGLFYTIIIYSSSAWNPNTLSTFFILMLVGFWHSIKTGKHKGIIFGWLGVIISISFHYQSLAVIPFVIIINAYLWFKKSNLKKSLILTPLILSFIFFSPMLFAEFRSDFSNFRSLITFFSIEHARYFDRVGKIPYLLTFYPSFYERVIVGDQFKYFVVGSSIYFGGIFSLFLLFLKNINRKMSLYVLIYILTSIFTIRLFKGDKLDYYLMIMIPSIPLLFSALIQVSIWPILKKMLFIALFLLIIISGFETGKTIRNQDLSALQKVGIYLDENLKEADAHFVFHNLNDVNVFYFIIKEFSNIKINQQSEIVVDICQRNDPWCQWRNRYKCSSHWPIKGNLLDYLENEHQNFELISRDIVGNYQIVIGKRSAPEKSMKNPLNTTNDQTGSDYLFEWL